MSAPRRVLHVTRDFPPNVNGGLSIAVGGLAAAQARVGLQCTVVSFDDYRHTSGGGGARSSVRTSTSDDGMRVIHVGNADQLAEAEVLAAEAQCEIVHVHHGLLWDFGAAVAARCQVPTVLTVHVLQAEQNRLRNVGSTHSSEAQKRALSECTRIHAPSQAVADLLNLQDSSYGQRIRAVRLGSNHRPPSSAARGSERLGPQAQLLYVGRFADINGFAELLQALPKLFEAHPALGATIVGGMPDNPRAEKRWKKRWLELGGAHVDRLRWAGWLPSAELRTAYGDASILVVPSWFETFGQVLLEGMLHGTPIITTGAGALAELADDSTALIIEPNSPKAIADAVLRTFENPEAAIARRDSAAQRVMQGHHWDDRVGDFVQLYADAAGAE